MSESDVKRVAAYCRVSTLQEEQEDSYELQCKYYEDLIRNQSGMVLVDVYGDQGVSGLSTEKRPDFRRMMRDCMAGKIDMVMTKSISRFARNLVDCISYTRKLREKGIPVVFEREGLNSMEMNGEMVLSLLAAIAQEEVNSLSRNIRWAHEKRNESGDPVRNARYGYRKAPKQKDKKQEWLIYEPEAKRVRLAFSLAAQGFPYRKIVDRLKAFEAKEKTGRTWTMPTLHNLLLSEVYIGDILTNKTYKPDYLSKKAVKNDGTHPQFYLEGHHEAIVDRGTFEKVGQMIKERQLRTPRKGRKIAQ